VTSTQEHSHIQLLPKDNMVDGAANIVAEKSKKFLGLNTGSIKSGKIFQIINPPNQGVVESFAHKALKDPVTHDAYVNKWFHNPLFKSYILIAKRPGVTDDEGLSAQRALSDFMDDPFEMEEQSVFTQEIFFIENALEDKDLDRIALSIGNPLIHHFEYGSWNGEVHTVPIGQTEGRAHTDSVNIQVSDEELLLISKKRHLCLNLVEMKAIQAYFGSDDSKKKRESLGLPKEPTDCEIEILAQTWSEHCKHKEMSAIIEYRDLDTGQIRTVSSLFDSKIKESTRIIESRLKKSGHHWLVKVFADNAGVVKIDNSRLFIWKVETHNTPSALDPYGGAITGILGNNRDALGTGIGGAKLLFNTNVLCFAEPTYSKKLMKGQLPPSRVLKGVVEGIMDGGNKSGVPTVNGSIVFDERYCGKPLVFCGTGSIMPKYMDGKESWHKPVDSGDIIVMAGGRVGKDGIHGATLSSSYVDADTPQTVVQIGSPMTQKLLADFLTVACETGLVKTCTDNGAGGLSSSIGEMAEFSNGAEVYLEKVPLKYSGLQPWEIFISESQERMTLVVKKEDLQELHMLAQGFAVELSEVGIFTSKGSLDVLYHDKMVAHLDLDFLHNGVPRKHLVAEWKRPDLKEPVLPPKDDYNGLLLQLMASYNICSKESVIRRYDHEVKGKTVVKPLMGKNGNAPQDAAVMRLDFDSWKGLIVSNGIIPRYGDIDAYHMSTGAFDEAVRQVISVGGDLPDLDAASSPFWSVNDNFCVPDSVYDPETNPDGKYKLAQLVRMCDGLYDMATAYNVPMTSGKDSMKNDFRDGKVKVSIPPTILYSMVSQIDDIRTATTTEFKAAGDAIYLLGKTYDELGGSEFYHLFGLLGANVPVVRKEEAIALYRKVHTAHQKRLLSSCHDLSDGGLSVALAESAFGGDLGANVALGEEDARIQLFSESHSRFVVSVKPELCGVFEELMQGHYQYLGRVTEEPRMLITQNGKEWVDLEVDRILEAWRGGLRI
jgi:phosphoribosylformylglycinamidine synthase II